MTPQDPKIAEMQQTIDLLLEVVASLRADKDALEEEKAILEAKLRALQISVQQFLESA